MAPTMQVAGTPTPVGTLRLHFQYFVDDGPPHAWVDIHSGPDDARLGGVAINCLDIGDVPSLGGLYGRAFAFGEDAGGELGESVFWAPGDRTLELDSLSLRFGMPAGNRLPLEILASCRDHDGRQGIEVQIAGEAEVSSGRP